MAISNIGVTLRSLLTSASSTFIVLNVGTNLVFLLRSYVAMRALDHEQLGVLALLQTLMLLIATLQFGVVNGGYRLLCSEGEESSSDINDFVFTFIGSLSAACVLMLIFLVPFVGSAQTMTVATLGVLSGTFTLLRNWLANHLIAKVKLRRFNIATIWSATASLIPLGFVNGAPLIACLLSVAIQPIAFVILVLTAEQSLRPRSVQWPQALVRRVMAAGFAVFLTAFLLQANQQIERWYVLKYLGLASLGHLYLAILYTNLFQLLPSTLDSLFLPRLAKAHEDGSASEERYQMRRFFIIVTAYCALSAVLTWLLAEPVLQALLPRYVEDLRFVWLFLPGLLLFTLSGPFAMVFNVLIRYGSYYWGYGLGTFVTVSVYAVCTMTGHILDLNEITLLKSAVYVLMAATLVLGYLLISRSHSEFRFDPLRGKGERA